MAKTLSVEKQKKRQKMVDLKWQKRQELKKIISSPTASYEEKLQAIEALNKLPRNSSPARLRNRCQLTGRSRGYLRRFNLSRISFRELCSKGVIPGVFKASW